MRARNWVGLVLLMLVMMSMFLVPMLIDGWGLGSNGGFALAMAQVLSLGLGAGLLLD